MSRGPRLLISPAGLDAVRSAAAAALPVECCGLLVGRREGADARVESVIAAANVAADPARFFEADPETLIAVHKSARRDGRELIGHYHSHPNGRSVPSANDRARAVAAGEAWLIVPVTGAGFAAMEIVALS